MSSIWRLNGGDVYVSEYGSKVNPTIAELNPINSTSSVYHYIFTPDEEVSIGGMVIGSGHLTTIQNGIHSEVTLITDLEPGGITVLFQDMSAERIHSSCQLVDAALPTNAPVYDIQVTVRLV